MPVMRHVSQRSPVRKTRTRASLDVDDEGWPAYDPSAFEAGCPSDSSSPTPSPPPIARHSSILPESGRTIYDKSGSKVKTKRPRNSFMFFRSDVYRQHHRKVKAGAEKKMDQNQLSRLAGEKWRLLTPEAREPFQGLAREEKLWYHENIPDYAYTTSAKGKERRRTTTSTAATRTRTRRRSSATNVDLPVPVTVKLEVEAVQVPPSPQPQPSPLPELRAPRPVKPIHIESISEYMAEWPGSEPEQPLDEASKEAFAHNYEHALSHPIPSSLQYLNCGHGTGFESEALVLENYHIEASESVPSYPAWWDSPTVVDDEPVRSSSVVSYATGVWDDWRC